MGWYNRLYMTSKIVLPVAFVLVAALSFLTWQIESRTSSTIVEVANRELAALAGEKGNSVREFLNMAINQAASLADGLEKAIKNDTLLSRQALISMQTGIYEGNSSLFAIGSMWEPEAFDGNDAAAIGTPGSGKDGRFLPYCANGSPVTELSQSLNESYYLIPQQTLKPYVTEPYSYTLGSKNISMSSVSYPVVVDHVFKGIVIADITLEELDTLVKNIKIYKTGYGGLVTSTGTIVAHPEKNMQGVNLFTTNRLADPQAARDAFNTGQVYIEHEETPEGLILRYYHPISLRGTGQNWYVALIVPLKEVLAEATSISIVTLVLCGITLFLLLGVILILVRAAMKPVSYLANTAEIIAAGNLQQPIDDTSFGGEMKKLSTSLKKMIHSLINGIQQAEALTRSAEEESQKAREAMEKAKAASNEAQDKTQAMLAAANKLEEVAQTVFSASSELSAQIEQCEQGASEQAARVTETATAMEEMNSTVIEVARNAGEASDTSTLTREKADKGAEIVQKAVASIRQVQEESLALKKDMATLSEQARSINQIMGVISDIADQTNLLALNAAIEAARAGEAGRGFAVVADEVRKLAEKTMASTTDVGNAISSIQSSATQSMAQVDRAVKIIEEATAFANLSGEALKEIVDMADNTADQVRGIATASEEQSASSEEINKSINQINTIAGETVRAMEESAKAVSDMVNQAQILTALIEEMKKG